MQDHPTKPTAICRYCSSEFIVQSQTKGVFCSRQCHYRDKSLRAVEGAASRFWSKVKKSDGCWEWGGSMFDCGYGAFYINGQNRGAHRIAWQFTHGPIPDGLIICHACDNKACVRPDHLFIGTQRDNIHDMIAKGRGIVGEMSGMAKLTDAQVRELRVLRSSGLLYSELGKHFRISATHARRICLGQSRRLA